MTTEFSRGDTYKTLDEQQIDLLPEPLLHNGPRHLIREGEKPPTPFKPVAFILVLYDTVERHEFACC